MDKNEIRSRLVDMLTPLCLARSLDIWGVELLFSANGRHKIVRIYIDSAEGVGIDQCEEVSRHLSLILDVEDIIPGAYTLEVSSPGLERTFFSLEQMRAYEEQPIRVRLHTALDGRKNFQGRLTSVRPPMFTLFDGNAIFELNWEHVSKANLVYEHRAPVKPGKR